MGRDTRAPRSGALMSPCDICDREIATVDDVCAECWEAHAEDNDELDHYVWCARESNAARVVEGGA